MAAGDPVAESTTVSGSSTAIVAVPSGETWVISSAATVAGVTTVQFKRSNPNTSTLLADLSQTGRDIATRWIFDAGASHDPEFDNQDCSSRTCTISGREI